MRKKIFKCNNFEFVEKDVIKNYKRLYNLKHCNCKGRVEFTTQSEWERDFSTRFENLSEYDKKDFVEYANYMLKRTERKIEAIYNLIIPGAIALMGLVTSIILYSIQTVNVLINTIICYCIAAAFLITCIIIMARLIETKCAIRDMYNNILNIINEKENK